MRRFCVDAELMKACFRAVLWLRKKRQSLDIVCFARGDRGIARPKGAEPRRAIGGLCPTKSLFLSLLPLISRRSRWCAHWGRYPPFSGKVQFQGRHLTRQKWLGGRNAGKVPGIELDLTRCGPGRCRCCCQSSRQMCKNSLQWPILVKKVVKNGDFFTKPCIPSGFL